MYQDLVSVCISVYNGEQYLKRCLDSIINQDANDEIEIVIVDDGSTDQTLQMLNKYRESVYDKRIIKIIHQEHSGLAQGRLTGVQNSSGQYITFLDADDYWLKGAYSTISEFMRKNNADIYEFQTIRQDYYSKSPYTGIIDGKKVLNDYFNGAQIPVNFWLRLFKRDLLKPSFFPVGISLYEDVYSFPCIISQANTIAYIDMPLHVHTQDNADSIMRKLKEVKDTKEYLEKRIILLKSIPHIMLNIGRERIENEYKESFNHFVSSMYCDFVFIKAKGVSYHDKLNMIISNLNLDFSTKELEVFIVQNLNPNSKINYLIRTLGLNHTYLLFKVLY